MSLGGVYLITLCTPSNSGSRHLSLQIRSGLVIIYLLHEQFDNSAMFLLLDTIICELYCPYSLLTTIYLALQRTSAGRPFRD